MLPACASEPRPDTGPVQVEEPGVRGDDVDAVCAALLDALPEEVDPGAARRPVEPETGRTAAWGDPPVTLECGVDPPERLEPPVVVNGVGWTVRDIGPGFRWTTSGRTVNVAVTVPDEYENGVEIIFPLSPPVAQAVPQDPTADDPTQPDGGTTQDPSTG